MTQARISDLLRRTWSTAFYYTSGYTLEKPPERETCPDLRNWALASLKWSVTEIIGRMHPNREILLLGNALWAGVSWFVFYTALRITFFQGLYDSNLQADRATQTVAALHIPMYVCATSMHIVSTLGFIAAFREIEFALHVYGHCVAVVALLMCVLLLITAVSVFAFHADILQLATSFGISFYTESDSFKKFVDRLQQEHNCCGVFSWRDWDKNSVFRCNEDNPSIYRCRIPESCCRLLGVISFEYVLNLEYRK